MAIYKPSNLDPDLKELDILNPEGNIFSCQVNTSGSSAMASKTQIVSPQGELIFQSDAKNLKKRIPNKNFLSQKILCREDEREKKIFIDNDTVGKSLEEGQDLTNGKDYQWNIRIYENTVGRTHNEKPNTLVCSGYLTGSTTYVIWLKNTSGVKNEQVKMDRYVEFKTAAGHSSDVMFPILPPNIDNKALPTEEFVERKKISWVEDELGLDKDFIKIELEDKLEYSYKDGTPFLIYECSDKHGYRNFYADPNDNIILGNFVEICSEDGQTIVETKRKIVGYSNDTGEIRVQEAFSSIPTNGLTYKLYEYNITSGEYTEKSFNVSNKIGGAPIYQTGTTPFTVYNNKWEVNGDKRLFIQPNINIKTDDTNPDQLVFDLGGQTININKKESTVGQYIPNKKTDITFNKLDNSQWLLICDSDSTSDVIDITAITPKNTYKVYTDFMDSIPNAIFYARTLPEIDLKVRDIHGASITSAYTPYNQNISDAFASITENDQIVFDFYKENTNVGRYRLGRYQASYDIGVVYFTTEVDLDIEEDYVYEAFIIHGETEIPITIPEDKNIVSFYEYLVSIDETVPITREVICRNVEFNGEWFQRENILIKYYNYTLYYINGYNEPQEIGASGDLYDIELKWVFKALETQKNYRIKLKVVDQYNQEYIIERDFFVNYLIEKSKFSSTYNLNCNETAIQVSVAVPSYVASDSTEMQESVDSTDILTTSKGSYVSTRNDKILNYSSVVGSLVGEKLEIPETFSYFTQFAFPHGKSGVTQNFFDNINGSEEKIITSVAHQHPNKFFIDKNFGSFWREIFPVTLIDEASSPSEVYLSILQDGIEVAKEKVINNGCDENTGLVEIANKVILQSYVNLTYKAYLLVDDLYTLIQLDEGCSDTCLVYNDVFSIKVGGIDKIIGESEENPNFLKLRVYKNNEEEALPCFADGNTYYDLYNNISLLKDNIIYTDNQEFALQREYKANTEFTNSYRVINTLAQLGEVLTNLTDETYKIRDKFLITSDMEYSGQTYLAGPYICTNNNSSVSPQVQKILQYNYTTSYLFNDPVINYENLKVDTYLQVNKGDTGGNVKFEHDDGEGTNFLWVENSASIKSYNESILGRLRFNLILIVDITTVDEQEQEKVVCGLKWEVV